MRMKAFAPNGNEVGGGELEMNMQTTPRTRGFVKMAGLPISSEGIFTIDVQVREPNDNWLTVKKLNLPVKILPTE